MAADGSLLVTDMFNHRLRRVLPDGMVSTVAGWESRGFADGEGTGARFNSPWGIAVDRHGTVYISDCGNHCIRKVSPCWAVSTLCGSTQRGHADELGVAAHFDEPRGLVLDAEGNLIVADTGNHCIRKVSVSDGRVTTVAGSRAGGNAAKAHADGRNLAARFNAPCGVAVDGNNAIFVSDWYNHRVRMISAEEGGQVTTVAGSSESGMEDGHGPRARFNEPWVAAMDEKGRLLVGDCENDNCLRVVKLPPPHDKQLATLAKTKLQEDYGQLLGNKDLADVVFAVDGEKIHGHRCVLAARSPFFAGMFRSGPASMREAGSGGGGGGEVQIEDVSAGAFHVLLRYLYTEEMPDGEDCGEGLAVGEMARVADRFQAEGLFEHCVGQFRGALLVKNVMERLIVGYESGLEELKGAAMAYLRANVIAFQKEALETLALLEGRHDLHVQVTAAIGTAFAALLPASDDAPGR